jgi:tripartite-type tricarboxylate transporter receptor subunit TctC
MRLIRSISVLCILFGVSGAAIAQTWPARPVRLVVPQSPGGATDFSARLIAQHLTAGLRQQVIVDNRPGAAGNIGTDLVAKSTPDGYTALFAAVASIAIAPHLYKNLPFDPAKDFAPVTNVANVLHVLVTIPSVPVKTVGDLVQYSKANPDKLSFGSPGTGEAGHLAGELFKTMTGAKMVHVPYKGGGPAMVALLGGQVQLVFATSATAIPHIKAGKLRAIGMTGAKRFEGLPDVPTIGESVPGYEVNNWLGVFFPAGTPQPIVNRLNAELVKVLQTPEVKANLLARGLEATWLTPPQFVSYIKSETTMWGKVVKESGATVD